MLMLFEHDDVGFGFFLWIDFLAASNMYHVLLGIDTTQPTRGYFDFGSRLMKKIANSLTQDVIKSELGVTKKAKQSLFRDNDLKQMFMNCCKDSNHLEKKQEKEKMYQELVNKTANAKYSDEFRAYREAHIQSVAGKKMRKALTLEPI